ncbi:MAG TPA: hypothetical protein H9729_01345, partial [Candidatus Borkfalkia excrementigallinarum]|nr:hypothetical protein [Candidatus Borkfalkia excrementigallinarum]
ENLAALRFSVRYSDLFFIKITRASKTAILERAKVIKIIKCAWQNDAFAKAPPSCRMLTALAGKVKLRHFNNMCAPKYAAVRKTPTVKRLCRAPWGFPINLGVSQATACRETREQNRFYYG